VITYGLHLPRLTPPLAIATLLFMAAKHELLQLKDKLQKQISILESEMATVDKAIQLLEREDRVGGATGPQDKRFRKLGLSATCRKIVGSEWLAPSEVRNQMMQGGYKSVDKSKLLGYVFATLKRLAAKGEMEGKKVDGKMKYRKRQVVALSTAEAA
jgi:hypothetical protein